MLIKKVLKQEIKSIRDVGMVHQKVYKQNIEVKVNMQSPIPTSFYTTVVTLV